METSAVGTSRKRGSIRPNKGGASSVDNKIESARYFDSVAPDILQEHEWSGIIKVGGGHGPKERLLDLCTVGFEWPQLWVDQWAKTAVATPPYSVDPSVDAFSELLNDLATRDALIEEAGYQVFIPKGAIDGFEALIQEIGHRAGAAYPLTFELVSYVPFNLPSPGSKIYRFTLQLISGIPTYQITEGWWVPSFPEVAPYAEWVSTG